VFSWRRWRPGRARCGSGNRADAASGNEARIVLARLLRQAIRWTGRVQAPGCREWHSNRDTRRGPSRRAPQLRAAAGPRAHRSLTQPLPNDHYFAIERVHGAMWAPSRDECLRRMFFVRGRWSLRRWIARRALSGPNKLLNSTQSSCQIWKIDSRVFI
jgi:hypothetical protein